MKTSLRPLIVLAVVLRLITPLAGQTDDLGGLLDALNKADAEKRTEDVKKVCDQILARDVVADYVNYGIEPMGKVVSHLKKLHQLTELVTSWKEELARSPDSERLNYLLAVAALSARNTSSEACGGRTSAFPPLHLRVKRAGSTFSGAIWNDKRGDWEELNSLIIAMPRKALIGFCGSAATALLKAPNLLANGEALPDAPWEQKQISRPATTGSLTDSNGGFQITGAGFPLHAVRNDDVFFAFREVEGDVSLEVTVESLDAQNQRGSAGVMIRGSLEPAAPFIALVAERRENSVRFWFRKQPSEAGKYLTDLCALRPHDPAFVRSCIQQMLTCFMNEAAKEAADRLIAAVPATRDSDSELFREIYLRSNLAMPVAGGQADPTPPRNEGERLQQAEELGNQAVEFQNAGKQEKAIECWLKMREMRPDQTLPLETHQQLIVSLMKLDRPDELKQEIKLLFLGRKPVNAVKDSGAIVSPSEKMLASVSLAEPCLVPPFMPAFSAAADYGVAVEIARELETLRGDHGQAAAAKAVAATLRLAAKDPAVLALTKKGGTAYLRKIDPGISGAGLALIAFQLQQAEETRPAAPAVLARLIEKRKETGFALIDLLLWKKRIDSMLGDKAAVERDQKELVAAIIESDRTPSPIAMSTAMQALLKNNDVAGAGKLAAAYERHEKRPAASLYDQVADAFGLLDLHQAKAVTTLPVLWTTSEGDSVRVHWELAQNPYPYGVNQEVLVSGVPTPGLDGQYDLRIYAECGLSFGSDHSKDDELVQIPTAASTGSWTGKIPSGHQWLVAVLKDAAGTTHRSLSIPATSGDNLLSPFHCVDVLAKQGPWSSPSKWFWGAALHEDFLKNACVISRLQHRIGAISIDHQPVPVDPSNEYVFAGWLKTDNGQGELAGDGYPAEAQLDLLFLDANGKVVGEFGEPTRTGGRWTLITSQFGPKKTGGMQMIPPSATHAKARIEIRTQCEVADVGFYRVTNGDSGKP